jgi:hypothetical protein
MDLAARLAAEAGSFASTVPDAAFPFDGDERTTWHYRPVPGRRGVPLWRLDRAGAKAAHRLLAVLLPEVAFAQAVAIMGLDEVLDLREGFARDDRHRGDYWVSVFGTPAGGAGTGTAPPWGVRFEGHHVSVHATVVGGEVTLTPLFLGANPAVVAEVSAPLRAEEALGFELLHALSVEQRASAVIAEDAPGDIVTRNAVAVAVDALDGGVPLSALTGDARRAADELVDRYLARIPAGARRPHTDGARFAWAGADGPGVGHYYRLSAPRLLVELDNTQDGANHVHTVVRDPASDFGVDVLAAHLGGAHGQNRG